jgi:hypothetical protein
MGENRASLAFAQPPAEYASFTDESFDILPPPIPGDRVSVFGEPPIASIPPLSEQNWPMLYDENAPPLFELKKINHRSLFTASSRPERKVPNEKDRSEYTNI